MEDDYDHELFEAIKVSLEKNTEISQKDNFKIPKLASPGSSKQVSIPDREKFLKNPDINPETGNKIKIGGPTYKKLTKKFGEPIISKNEQDIIHDDNDDFDDFDDDMLKALQESINEHKIQENKRIKEEQDREYEEAVKKDLEQKRIREIEENKKRLEELQIEKRKKIEQMKRSKLNPPVLKFPLIGNESSDDIFNIRVRFPDSRTSEYKFSAEEPYNSLIQQIRYDTKYIYEFKLFTGLGRFKTEFSYYDETPLKNCNIQPNTLLTFVEL